MQVYVCMYVSMYVCMYVCSGAGLPSEESRLQFRRMPRVARRELQGELEAD